MLRLVLQAALPSASASSRRNPCRSSSKKFELCGESIGSSVYRRNQVSIAPKFFLGYGKNNLYIKALKSILIFQV